MGSAWIRGLIQPIAVSAIFNAIQVRSVQMGFVCFSVAQGSLHAVAHARTFKMMPRIAEGAGLSAALVRSVLRLPVNSTVVFHSKPVPVFVRTSYLTPLIAGSVI